ncbi:MAG: cyclic nucleotide-binding domain-containing protein [Anditalea sp.]
MANVIVNRVKEFLKRFPPFSFLSDDLLKNVAKEVELMYFSKGEYLFYQGEPAKKHFFVIKEGFVNLTEDRNGVPQIMEYCDEGDVFGVLTLLGKRPYILNAFAAEDTLVYAVPVGVFERILEENNLVSLYFAAGFASGQVVVRSDLSQSQMARRLFTGPSKDKGLMVFSGR